MGFFSLSINVLLIFLVWGRLIKPLLGLSNASMADKGNKYPDYSLVSLVDDLNNKLVRLENQSVSTKASLEQSGQLVSEIEEDLRTLDSYSEHMLATDEELGFEPQLIEQAFSQSISAADYATSTFEQIYMSISNLGQGYNTVRTQSTDLQQSASAAEIQVQATKSNVTKLSLAASEINEVTKSISDIASMTQLLALNASIEAARAGESGRGFAVVADEVKKLASQTDKATKRISDISNGILSSSQESEASIDKIDELTKEINTIITSVFSNVESQWGDVQDLLGKMGQAAGTVSGLKGILMSSDNELKSHFLMLEGTYQFAKESAKTIKSLGSRLGISLPEDDMLEKQQLEESETNLEENRFQEQVEPQ
jgi:methyl-accepting chemotaxis protein